MPRAAQQAQSSLVSDQQCAVLPVCGDTLDGACCISASSRRASGDSDESHVLGPREVLFASDTDVEYRIPSLVRTRDGVLVAFAERRFGTVPGDLDTGFIEVVYRVRLREGQPWGDITTLCSGPPSQERPYGLTCGNPTSVYDDLTDQIVVLMSVNDGDVSLRAARTGTRRVPVGGRRVVVSVSTPRTSADDSALRFSDPLADTADLTALVQPPDYSWDAVGPGAGVQLGNGTLAFPAKGRNVFFDLFGAWSYRTLDGAGADPPEGTLLERNDGSLLRNDRADGDMQRVFRRLRSVSTDPEFTSWTPYTQTEQPLTPGHYCDPSVCDPHADTCPPAFAEPRGDGCRAPPSHVHAAIGRVADDLAGRVFFVNPGNTQRRAGLVVQLSYDEGDTWPIAREVEPTDYTVGYSAAVADGRGAAAQIFVAFEHSDAGRHSIQFRRVPVAWVVCGRIEPIHIGGNSWMGAYENAVRATDGTVTYVGRRAGGREVRVSSRVGSLQDIGTEVVLETDGFSGMATMTPSQPGVFVTDSGQRFTLDRYVPIDGCIVDPVATSVATDSSLTPDRVR